MLTRGVCQDLISRFTLDSATEFLFGKDVSSLSAGLVYPPNSPPSTCTVSQNHLVSRFFRAFLEAQSATAFRGRVGKGWRLFEFWGDNVKKHMHICHEYIDPILEEALSKKKALREDGLVSEKNEEEPVKAETLLDHLVNYTEGECSLYYLAHHVCDFVDHVMIRDEIMNIMIAGRDTVRIYFLCCMSYVQSVNLHVW